MYVVQYSYPTKDDAIIHCQSVAFKGGFLVMTNVDGITGWTVAIPAHELTFVNISVKESVPDGA